MAPGSMGEPRSAMTPVSARFAIRALPGGTPLQRSNPILAGLHRFFQR